MHYTGWIYDNRTETKHGKTFDSSFKHGQPFTFALGRRPGHPRLG